jgi:hypothetical protein
MYLNIIFQHPVALYRSGYGVFVPSMCNIVYYYFFVFLYWTLQCFGLTGHLQEYKLSWLRILLITVMRFSFSGCYCLWLLGYVGYHQFCLGVLGLNVVSVMSDALCWSFLKVYMYIQLLYMWRYLWFSLGCWLWLPWMFLLVREFCCVLVGHHSLSLCVFSRPGLCCVLLSGVCFLSPDISTQHTAHRSHNVTYGLWLAVP